MTTTIRGIPVVYAVNDNYAPYVDVSIRSLEKNGKGKFDVYVFHTGLTEGTVNKLTRSNDVVTVTCLDVTDRIEKVRGELYTHGYFSREMYYRILIADVLSEYDRAIYLDADTVILGNLADLYDVELGDDYVAACRNPMHKKMYRYVKERLKLNPHLYVNSGVMVINCRLFREENVRQKFFSELSNRGQLLYPDQDLINLVCSGRIKYLPIEWNYLWHFERLEKTARSELRLLPGEREEYFRAAQKISVLHFTGDKKPWHYTAIMRAEKFWEYAAESPFYGELSADLHKKNGDLTKYKFEFLRVTKTGLLFTCSVSTVKKECFGVICNGNVLMPEFVHKINTVANDVLVTKSVYRFEVKREEITGKGATIYLTENGKSRMFEYGRSFPLNGHSRSYFSYRNDFLIYREKKGLILKKSSFIRRAIFEIKYLWQLAQSDKRDKKTIPARWFYFLTRWAFPKNIWLFSDRPNVAGDNGEALFRYVSKKVPKKEMRPYFIIDKKADDYRRLRKYGKVVGMQTTRHKILLLHARGVALSQTDYSLFSAFWENAVKDILYKKKKVFLQHGVTKDDVSHLYSRYNQGFDLFITAAYPEQASILNNPNYGCDKTVAKLTGFPRHDLLKEGKEKVIVVSPTWRRYLLKDTETGEPIDSFTESEYYKKYHALLSDSRLWERVKKAGYRLLFVPHDKMEKTIPFFEDIPGLEIVGRKNRSYADLFSESAFMVSDYSSNTFEFSILKKPIVYFQFDKEEFFRSHTYEKGYFDYEKDGFGAVCTTVDGVVDAVIKGIDSGCEIEEKYEQRISSFYAFGNEGNCKRVYEAIRELLRGEE